MCQRNLDLCDEGGLVPRVHERHVAGAVDVPGHRVVTAIPKGVINFDEIRGLEGQKLPGTSGVDPKGGDTRISRQGAG